MFNDLGGEYLLFLDHVEETDQVPPQARRATEVNYSCGQSKVWSRVTMPAQQRLEALARGKQVVYKEPLATDQRFKPR